jgi:hypothetical protein
MKGVGAFKDLPVLCPALQNRCVLKLLLPDLLGLLDEYKEPNADMRCRALSDSIMSNLEGVDLPDLVQAEKEVPNARPEPQAYYPDRSAYFAAHAEARFRSVDGIFCTRTYNGTHQIFDFNSAEDRKGYELMFFPDYGVPGVVYNRLPTLYVPDSKEFTGDTAVKMPSEWMTGSAHLDPQIWSCEANRYEVRAVLQTGGEILKLAASFDGTSGNVNKPLRPAHFRKFLNLTCTVKNRIYDLCTSEDYLTPPRGYQCVIQKNPICNSPEWLN